MWIVKGVLLGLLLFIVGGISYVGIRVATVLNRLRPQVKAGTITRVDGGAQYDIRIWLGPLHGSVILAVFLAATGIGIWIVQARTHAV